MQAWLGLEYVSRVALWALFFAWGMSVVQVPYGSLLGLLLVKLCHLMSVLGTPAETDIRNVIRLRIPQYTFRSIRCSLLRLF